jgi:hypothetical protein
MALIIVTALPKPVTHPGFIDAAQLAAACAAEGPRAPEMRAVCLGYVTGATDQLLARTSGRRPPTICPPAGFTPADAVAAVQRHARFASTTQGVGAAGFVRFALERAHPCPVERSPR